MNPCLPFWTSWKNKCIYMYPSKKAAFPKLFLCSGAQQVPTSQNDHARHAHLASRRRIHRREQRWAGRGEAKKAGRARKPWCAGRGEPPRRRCSAQQLESRRRRRHGGEPDPRAQQSPSTRSPAVGRVPMYSCPQKRKNKPTTPFFQSSPQK